MTAQQVEANTEERKNVGMHFYTTEESVNELLNEYVQRAYEDQVWMSVDGAGLQKNALGNSFCELLGFALSRALETCVVTTPPKKRYLKVRSMNVQNKVFIKILYSCEEPAMAGFDRRYHRMKEMIEHTGGYMRLRFDEEENVLEIAVPI